MSKLPAALIETCFAIVFKASTARATSLPSNSIGKKSNGQQANDTIQENSSHSQTQKLWSNGKT